MDKRNQKIKIKLKITCVKHNYVVWYVPNIYFAFNHKTSSLHENNNKKKKNSENLNWNSGNGKH